MHGVLNLLSCLGWSSARWMLPFLDGGWTGVMQAGLAGLLLSAFRLDDVPVSYTHLFLYNKPFAG